MVSGAGAVAAAGSFTAAAVFALLAAAVFALLAAAVSAAPLPPPPPTPAAPLPPPPPPPPLPDGRQELRRVVDAHRREVQRRRGVLAEGVAGVGVRADARAEAGRPGVEEVEPAAVPPGGDELALGADEAGCLFWDGVGG